MFKFQVQIVPNIFFTNYNKIIELWFSSNNLNLLCTSLLFSDENVRLLIKPYWVCVELVRINFLKYFFTYIKRILKRITNLTYLLKLFVSNFSIDLYYDLFEKLHHMTSLN